MHSRICVRIHIHTYIVPTCTLSRLHACTHALTVKVSEVKYVDDVEVPSPRVNACFVAHPTKNNLILYGGEFYNGRNCTTFGDFFLFNIQKQTWRWVSRVQSPPSTHMHACVRVYCIVFVYLGALFINVP